MLRRSLCLAAAAALVTAGCGGGADSLMKDMISDMNALADAVEKNESEAKVKEIQDRMQATTKKLDDLKLSDDDKKKLIEKHKAELEKAGQRMAGAMAKKMFGGMGMPNLGGGIPGMPGGGFTVPNLGGGAAPPPGGKTNQVPDPGK